MTVKIVIKGPMWAGKTGRIINIFQKTKGEKFFYKLCPGVNKYDIIASRDNDKVKGVIISDISVIAKSENIFIDEIQFAPEKDLKRFLEQKKECNIYVSGLDMDWRQQPFSSTMLCISKAKNVVSLKARCDLCGSDCKYTTKKIPNNERIEVGEENYFPICGKCLRKKAAC